MSKKAYVTSLLTENYIEGVLCLKKSLDLVKSKYPLVVLVGKEISEKTEKVLQKNGMDTIRIPDFELPEEILEINKKNKKVRWSYAFNKLYMFKLIQFEKIVFLDSDLYIRKNIDDLFEKEDFSAVVDRRYGPNKCGKWMKLTSGVMVIKPEEEKIEEFIQLIGNVAKLNMAVGDQDILQEYDKQWGEKKEKHLSIRYNVFFPYLEYYINFQEYSLDDIYVIHYIYPIKPWMITDKNRIEEYIKYINDFTAQDYEESKIEAIKDAVSTDNKNAIKVMEEYYNILDEVRGKME